LIRSAVEYPDFQNIFFLENSNKDIGEPNDRFEREKSVISFGFTRSMASFERLLEGMRC
jgi:hypothetical protein